MHLTSFSAYMFQLLDAAKVGILGHGPGALFGHTLMLHPWRPSSLIIYGGRDRHTKPVGDVWVLDLGQTCYVAKRKVGVWCQMVA